MYFCWFGLPKWSCSTCYLARGLPDQPDVHFTDGKCALPHSPTGSREFYMIWQPWAKHYSLPYKQTEAKADINFLPRAGLWEHLVTLNEKLHWRAFFLYLLSHRYGEDMGSLKNVSHTTGIINVLLSNTGLSPNPPPQSHFPHLLSFASTEPDIESHGQLLCKCELRVQVWCLGSLKEMEIPSHWGHKHSPLCWVHGHYQCFNIKSLASWSVF